MKNDSIKKEKQENNIIKRGFCNGVQIFYNKETGKHFLETKKELGYSKEFKQKAIDLFLEGNSFRSIGRILNCSDVSVMNWIRKEADKIDEKELFFKVNSENPEIEMDEMWHYAQKKE
jgi:transposase-like protein